MYEEELYADNLNKSRKGEPAAESSKKPFHEKNKEGKVAREGKGPNSLFTEYTPLAMSMHLGTFSLCQRHHGRNGEHLHGKHEKKVRRAYERQPAGPSNSNTGGRPPLAFYDSELLDEASNSTILLLIRASMTNTDVRRVLIDTGASCNIMYTGLSKIFN